MTELDLTLRELAAATGIDENKLSKSLGKAGRRITVPEMAAIEAVLSGGGGGEPAAPALRSIPLLGAVPAGGFREAVPESGRRHAIADPDTPPHAFALVVSGDSMDLIAPEGTIVVIDPDDKALWPGWRYVVQTADGDTTFKEYQEGPARLVPCSSNPAHKEIVLGAEPITIIGRVFSYSFRDLPRRRL
ncbi:LexA family protein [Flavisphingomonas formosensis]|uniref:LexA family protein n=1 Tax=Flavisphingomonas formosensis TaxID=861534 RepID=UPI001E572650|nr:S24 family peptidase [Sphingomonas formosensis]